MSELEHRVRARTHKGPTSGAVFDTKSIMFRGANLNIIRAIRRGETMGAFILGLIIGAGGALALFIYDEGELFLKLSRQIKQTAERYRQSP